MFIGNRTGRPWAAILLVVAGCATTKLVDTWTEPTARGASLSRLAVIYMSPSDTTRRIAEDAAVHAMSKIKGAQVVASYHVLSGTDMPNLEAVRARLEQAGLDGALVMRPAGVQRRLVGDPGFYPTFTGYWGWAYPMAYGPGYIREETIVRLDTRLYSLKDDKLIWAGMSNTSDPSSINRLVHEVATKVAKALQRDDLVASTGAAPPLAATR